MPGSPGTPASQAAAALCSPPATLQFVLAIVFVALYVLATYSPPAPGSLRYKADTLLCALFAAEYVHRMLVRFICSAAAALMCFSRG